VRALPTLGSTSTRKNNIGGPILLVLLWCSPLAGCGSFFLGFVSNPGGPTTVSGTISVVSLGVFNDPAGATTFTAVTLINPGDAATINFCGDQRSLFPENTKVRADFNTGFSCSVLIRVVIL
jgi:hypothetical protein